MSQYPVRTIEDAYDACHPEEPLLPGDPRYVDLITARGDEALARSVAWRIVNTRPPRFHRQLVTGFRGGGKSTELRQLEYFLLHNGYLPVYLDVEDGLDLGDLGYQDLMVAIARAVEETLRGHGVVLNASLLKDADRWLGERVLPDEQHDGLRHMLKAEQGNDARVPLFTRLLTVIGGQLRSGGPRRQAIRQTLEQDWGVFMQVLSALLDDARQRLQYQHYRDLVVIVDGLEKLRGGDPAALDLFVRHAGELKAPRCHLVYTVPVSLVFDAGLRDAFEAPTVVLPMVDHASAEGRQALLRVIKQRLDIDAVFSRREVAERLIAMSGGSLRDLLRLVRIACEGAQRGITAADGERAVRTLAREFDRLLGDEDLEALCRVASRRRISGDAGFARLVRLRLVHEYQNDERWADLHPLLQQLGRVRARLQE
ncbi:MAG: hypothetical protein M3Z21_04350 [Pseudomonadota bacterium]|nr:hypothetical protein [Pseudomonadota bacterium]